ncbi:6-carboxyhexanoate-CoA ligase [Thermocrinis minervae]|uniref:6-carboxyhexanoate--CoA ligase n=2 Tax=Thermocrinis minervae TaxID=381751 RepID=A0A1M6RP55_9AQUI|nr:6-carboxyhexanoate-CoA ligase [Thermocrinis minervae]
MRAELEGKHVSGAERLVKEEKDIRKTLQELIRRPKVYDKMVLTVEKVQVYRVINKALPIYSYDFKSPEEAHSFAVMKLKEEGIPEEIGRLGIELLKKGPNPKGGNMRGAVLLDVETGQRLEPDMERGIRTVRVDWEDRSKIREELKRRGIKKHYLNRLMDALAIATKNIHCGVIAELCWSDDPDYTTGYVAGKNIGYVRIKPMKYEGIPVGGRVYFIKNTDIQTLIECLERKVFLIKRL